MERWGSGGRLFSCILFGFILPRIEFLAISSFPWSFVICPFSPPFCIFLNLSYSISVPPDTEKKSLFPFYILNLRSSPSSLPCPCLPTHRSPLFSHITNLMPSPLALDGHPPNPPLLPNNHLPPSLPNPLLLPARLPLPINPHQIP